MIFYRCPHSYPLMGLLCNFLYFRPHILSFLSPVEGVLRLHQEAAELLKMLSLVCALNGILIFKGWQGNPLRVKTNCT